MKKKSILLLLLLSVQLYGCSNNLTDHQETVVPMTELSLVEENSPEESAATVEEFNNDNAASGLETGNNPDIIDSTDGEKTDVYSQPEENSTIPDNTVDSPQNTSPQSEENKPTADSNYYRAATGISSAEVEQYAAQVRQQFLAQDWSAISAEIAYPITISDITYENSEDFLNASGSFGNNLDEAFLSAVEREDCVEMFCNYEGIMIGESGQIWISEVLNTDFSSQGLKITAINGLLK